MLKNIENLLNGNRMFFEDDLERDDWPLLQNGAVNLFYKASVFKETISSLTDLGYDIVYVQCDTVEQFKADISIALHWEDQFGYKVWNGNLDALNDGFASAPMNEKGQLAIACHNFEKLCLKDKKLADGFLDILEYQSRNHLLFSERLIALIQTNDPYFECYELGSRAANWNRKEWLNSDRGI